MSKRKRGRLLTKIEQFLTAGRVTNPKKHRIKKPSEIQTLLQEFVKQTEIKNEEEFKYALADFIVFLDLNGIRIVSKVNFTLKARAFNSPLNGDIVFKYYPLGKTRKYECLKTSLFLARNLGIINSAQNKIDVAIEEGVFPFFGVSQKLYFYRHMLHMKRTLKLAKRGDHISLKDYFKLRNMWLQILLRIYQPA